MDPCHRPWSPCEPRSASPPPSPHQQSPPPRPGGCTDRRRRRRRGCEPHRGSVAGRPAPLNGLRGGQVCVGLGSGHRDPGGRAGHGCQRPGRRGRGLARCIPPVAGGGAFGCRLVDSIRLGRPPGRHGYGAEREQSHRHGRLPLGQRLPDLGAQQQFGSGLDRGGADHPTTQRASQPAGPAAHRDAPGSAADDHPALATAVQRARTPRRSSATARRSVML